ncbi:MAG: MFS transporter [Clostridia bacterium]|nr:MFS transporter [Clostridia bacterium]
MKRSAWGGAVFMAAAYGANAVYQGYIGKYFQQRGVEETALPWLLAAFPLMSAPAQMFWGGLSDRTGRRTAVLRAAILLSMLILTLYPAQRGLGGLLAIGGAFAGCYPAIQPLGDGIVLKKLQKDGQPYGPTRLAGGLSYALCSLAAGEALKDGYGAVPLIVCCGLGITLAASFLLPRDASAKEKRQSVSALRTLRLPYMKPLLALFMALQATLGYFFSYYALLFTALPGGGSRLLGLSLFIASVSEIPFLLLGDRLFKRFGAGKLMLLSAAALSLRYLILGLCRSVAVAMASQLLHGLGFVVIAFSMAKYLSLAAPEELRSGGQTLVSAAGFGIARVLGGLAGRVVDLRTGFLIMAAAGGLTFVMFLPVFSRLPPLNGNG